MTTIPRLFVTAPLTLGARVAGSGMQAHYLGRVVRRDAGSLVHLFNGRDGEWAARIATLRRGEAEFTVESQLRPQAPEADIWLAFALLKRDATDLVIQKATELGAAALLPVITEHTNTGRLNDSRLAAIAIEAAEQCERLTIPALHPATKLADLLATWPAERRLFSAIEREAAPHLRPAQSPAALLIGPEGGFTPAEVEALRRHPLVTPVSLGPRILRAETACLAGLALLQAPLSG
ncbi:MAG TPA: 16S rRNA (uracil(1498)-N(3))-methyltransferase [Acetobacteraceae bacterium]|jgi:16S rRNA (uracil1498-N3)-methyltransferase